MIIILELLKKWLFGVPPKPPKNNPNGLLNTGSSTVLQASSKYDTLFMKCLWHNRISGVTTRNQETKGWKNRKIMTHGVLKHRVHLKKPLNHPHHTKCCYIYPSSSGPFPLPIIRTAVPRSCRQVLEWFIRAGGNDAVCRCSLRTVEPFPPQVNGVKRLNE